MADPLSVVGVVYPIACHLVILVQELQEIYEGVRYAKQDLQKMSDRTKIVAGTYDFFKETMKGVQQIEKLSKMFAEHGDLKKSGG